MASKLAPRSSLDKSDLNSIVKDIKRMTEPDSAKRATLMKEYETNVKVKNSPI